MKELIKEIDYILGTEITHYLNECKALRLSGYLDAETYSKILTECLDMKHYPERLPQPRSG